MRISVLFDFQLWVSILFLNVRTTKLLLLQSNGAGKNLVVRISSFELLLSAHLLHKIKHTHNGNFVIT